MTMKYSIDTPNCPGINHADFSIDGRYGVFTCEYGGALARSISSNVKVLGYLKLSKGGMPQDVRISPDGKVFYVADMKAEGVLIVDGDKFIEIGHMKTGLGHPRPLSQSRWDQALCGQPRRCPRLRPA